MNSVSFTAKAQKDLTHFASHNREIHEKIKKLVRAIAEDPFNGIGKPEPLKFELSGHWSRRIDHKNRLVYRVEGKQVVIISCRHHY